MGEDPAGWRWDKLHSYVFKHLGATNGLIAALLNRGPYPAPGDDNTVNVSWSQAVRGSYEATVIPSMRLVAAPADPDGLWVVGPLGQSGQPGHPHYDDLMKPFLDGELVRVPLTPAGVRAVTREVLLLRPPSSLPAAP
jgi:acyl-homoserine lactone acylase PvdQ